MQLARWLKKAQLAMLTMGSSVFIAACYGAQYMDPLPGEAMPLATGKVSHEGEPVVDIEICATPRHGDELSEICDYSNEDGSYAIDAPDSFVNEVMAEGLRLSVRDVDGADHGEYEPQDIDVAVHALPTQVDVQLEPTAADSSPSTRP